MRSLATAIPFLLGCGAQAAPTVLAVPAANAQNVLLSDLDPSLPPVRIRLDAYDPGGGSAYVAYTPVLVEDAVWCFDTGPTLIDIEVADLQQFEYPSAPGDLVSASTGSWIYTDTLCDSVPAYLPPVYYQIYTYLDGCYSCDTLYFLNGRMQLDAAYYLPFRWKPISSVGDWTYGWVSFEGKSYESDCYEICKPSNPEPVTFADFRFTRVGIETEPGVPLTVAGGYCAADINFDAATNAFDIFDFIDLYLAHDPRADLTDDANFNFFDFKAYLGLFNSDCQP